MKTDHPNNQLRPLQARHEPTVQTAGWHPSRLLQVLAALLAFVTPDGSAAIPVGTGGSGTVTFDTIPGATEWSTLTSGVSPSGASGAFNADTPTAGAGINANLDSGISPVTAASVNAPLTSQGSNAQLPTAAWRNDLANKAIMTRTGTAGITLLMATLQNTSGSQIDALNVIYQLTTTATPIDEQITGHRVYYSKTGAAGSWTAVGNYTISAVGTVTINIPLTSLAWSAGGTLYVLWADDNGNGTEGDYVMDDVRFGLPGPPWVTITSPANGATVGTSFTISADAADTDGTVSSVAFYDGITLLATDTTSPYSYTWTGASAGNHALQAVATDNSNTSTTSSTVNVTVVSPIQVGVAGSGMRTFDTLPPAIQWSTLSVAGAAADVESDPALDTAMSSIAASSITATVGTQTGSGATANAYWRSGDLKLGTQPTGNKMTLLMASLENNSGGTIDGLTVAYTLGLALTPGEVIKGHRVYWSKTGAAGTWTAVGDFLLTAPGTTSVTFSIPSLAWANGGTLFVVWVDDNGTNPDGDYTIDNVNFTVTGPQPPTVAITSPTNGATVGTNFTITADAADSDGTVTSVAFYDGATLLGTDTTLPYSYPWTGASVGPHTLTAVVVDSTSLSTTSAVVNVTVSSNSPPVITPTAPADEATGISTATTVSVATSDPEGAATTVTFYGRKTTPLTPGPDFTLMTLPDTQFYAENTGGLRAATYYAQTQWITDNRDTLNVAFVSHMGDIVQNGDFSGNPREWLIADSAMRTVESPLSTLRAHGIPWGGAPGNHDQSPIGDAGGSTVFYNEYFGSSRFTGRTYYGGHYGINNNNNYQLFSASGLDFVILHLEYDTRVVANYQAVLDWADAVLKAYPHRRAIVTSHWMVNTGNPATFSAQGQEIYNNLKDNPNLFLLLGGHVSGEGRRSDVFTGRTVHSILQDYQGRVNGGDGWLRYFVFSPANNTITAKTYKVANAITPTSGYETDADSEFTLTYNMQSAVADWIPLGTVNVPAGGTVANLNWTGLEAGSRYEWYATVSDGISTVASTTRRFATTAPVSPTVALTAPANGVSYAPPGTINLTATASDADGAVTRVEFYGGGTKVGEDASAPYEFAWNNAPSGTYALTAVAVDNSNRATLSAVVNVTVTGSAPAVALTSPAEGATGTAPATISFAANASDTDGTVAKVEFYQGSFKVGEDTTAPYTYDWTNVAPGNYLLSAVATDNAGNRTASVPVSNVISAVSSSGTLTRSSYLQKAAPTQMTIRWRSSLSTVGRVRYGTSVFNLHQFVNQAATPAVAPAAGFDYVVTLPGLAPATTYYYSIGSASDTLASGPTYTFTTPPTPGTSADTRIWVLGDAGTANASQTGVRDAFYTWTGTRTPNLVLQLGDNAYSSGLDSEFQGGMFNIYPTMLRQTPFWSCLGNHETAQATAFNGSYPYFDIYTLPIAGECGGVSSGTEHYYSFDYGNIHFIALDSMTSDRSPVQAPPLVSPLVPGTLGAMAQWLRDDLASTTATWIVCFFHHPPYTKGSHDSDTETELIQMRTNLLPILEAGGVDLVLTGHSHCYERSYLLDGHYGLSGTLAPAMKKNAGNGRPLGSGAYIKPLTGPRDHFGAVYAVAGSAGQATGGSLNHPAHYISLNNTGSLVLDVNGTRLDATFLRENGSTPDTFTIIKQGAADSDSDGIPDEYEIANGLNRFNAADAALDSDGDGYSNLKEFIFSTASNAATSRYAWSTTYNTPAGTATVTFPTVTGRTYRVMYSNTLLSWLPASAPVAGTGGTLQWTDDGTATGSLPSAAAKRFYLIEVTVVP